MIIVLCCDLIAKHLGRIFSQVKSQLARLLFEQLQATFGGYNKFKELLLAVAVSMQNSEHIVRTPDCVVQLYWYRLVLRLSVSTSVISQVHSCQLTRL